MAITDNSKIDINSLEEAVNQFWEKHGIFQKSVDRLAKNGDFVIYDGPPFATGTPHYGHIVPSLIKDVIPRYQTMNGYKVVRRWGWDCHGLPIENIVEKELGSKNKKDIEAVGVDKFNELCRSKVLGYAEDWRKFIRRLGRWVDMEQPYQTMDKDYMESVWWVFKSLWDKDLIYEGYRSMHICPRCETTLSQSEVAEGYKDIKDLSATVKFNLLPGQKAGNLDLPDRCCVLAWTTTPWTLLANVALAVNPEVVYCLVKVVNEESADDLTYILAKARAADVFKGREFTIIRECKGADLLNLKYQPVFDFYAKDQTLAEADKGWKIYGADFVTTEDGTGVVHIAPAFGEDDLRLGQQLKLPFVQHIGMDGVISQICGEFAGLPVKPIADHQATDVAIIKALAAQQSLFAKEKYEHSYPHCWRCDTPLLNYATSSWFVNVLKIKERALTTAQQITWSPDHIKSGRFGQWLSGARDWSISRQRFWASCLPIWKCSACGQLEVFGAAADLEKRCGQAIDDLHKHVLDRVTFSCNACSETMRRVPDVLDTWFDSGSMPYAQAHYPFAAGDNWAKSFPADFIAEGVDQTRAWFYYMHILSTALFERPAFKQAVVNGIVLAEDGKKMSKKLANYPDPLLIMDKYGADALRFYLLSSPVVQAENLNFSESGVLESFRKNIMLLLNVYNFYESACLSSDSTTPDSDATFGDVLDVWIKAKLNRLIVEVGEQLTAGNLPKAARAITEFIDELSTWYVRRSRQRLHQSSAARDALRSVLENLSKIMAPFAPFIAEHLWQKVSGFDFKSADQSVHLTAWPESAVVDDDCLFNMAQARRAVELALAQRDAAKLKIRQPLNQLVINNCQLSQDYLMIIAEELNVKQVICHPGDGDVTVELDLTLNEDLLIEGAVRELSRAVNGLRKACGLSATDRVKVYYVPDEQKRLSGYIELQQMMLCQATGSTEWLATDGWPEDRPEATAKVEGEPIKLSIELIN